MLRNLHCGDASCWPNIINIAPFGSAAQQRQQHVCYVTAVVGTDGPLG